jgi:hypothetical protein
MEAAAFLARFQNIFHRDFTHAFDGSQAETNDRSLPRGSESHLALVDVGREHFDPECPGFIDEHAQLGGVAHVVGHHRAEKLDRVIRLQIGGLVATMA